MLTVGRASVSGSQCAPSSLVFHKPEARAPTYRMLVEEGSTAMVVIRPTPSGGPSPTPIMTEGPIGRHRPNVGKSPRKWKDPVLLFGAVPTMCKSSPEVAMGGHKNKTPQPITPLPPGIIQPPLNF